MCMWGVHVPVQIPEYNSKSECMSFVSCQDASVISIFMTDMWQLMCTWLHTSNFTNVKLINSSPV